MEYGLRCTFASVLKRGRRHSETFREHMCSDIHTTDPDQRHVMYGMFLQKQKFPLIIGGDAYLVAALSGICSDDQQLHIGAMDLRYDLADEVDGKRSRLLRPWVSLPLFVTHDPGGISVFQTQEHIDDVTDMPADAFIGKVPARADVICIREPVNDNYELIQCICEQRLHFRHGPFHPDPYLILYNLVK